MTGQAHWLTLLLILGFAGAIAAYLAGTGRLLSRYRAVQRGFLCPRTGIDAHLHMVRNQATGEWTGVTECSARIPGQPCTMECVKFANARAGSQPPPEPPPYPTT